MLASRRYPLLLIVMLATPAVLRAQVRVVGPGSTPQGDALRGEGVYLQGMGWYELNDAKAMAINVETARKVDAWNRQVYDAYLKDRDAAISRRRNMTNAEAEAAAKRRAERELKLRTSPAAEDIRKGEALNALLLDLSDPRFDAQRWHSSRVELPPELSVRSLVFRFAPKSGAKGSQALGSGVIALSRLDAEGRWPTVLKGDEIREAREGYESAYREVRERCLSGKLDLNSILTLDRAIRALGAQVKTKIPADRGFRAIADRFISQLTSAAKMFDADTVDYAQEMVADTQTHDAHSVGELLAFMRKYRLMFADAGDDPRAGELYRQLYGIMREQKSSLESGHVARPTAERGGADEDAEELLKKISNVKAALDKIKFDKGNPGDDERTRSKQEAIDALDKASEAIKSGVGSAGSISNAMTALESLSKLFGNPTNKVKVKSMLDTLRSVQKKVK